MERKKGALPRLRQYLSGGFAEAVPVLRIELSGDRLVSVEGCTGLLECSPCCIRLSAGRKIIRICGDSLLLRSIGDKNAVVEGKISGIDFQ